jgi:hypothetical protein
MIKIRYIKESAGIQPGTIKVWKDNHSGLVRALVAKGVVEVVVEKEKAEKLPTKNTEKIETKAPPKKVTKK